MQEPNAVIETERYDVAIFVIEDANGDILNVHYETQEMVELTVDLEVSGDPASAAQLEKEVSEGASRAHHAEQQNISGEPRRREPSIDNGSIT